MNNNDTTQHETEAQIIIDNVTANDIKLADIGELSREIDGELQMIINNEVGGQVLETTSEVARKLKVKLTQELVTKVYDKGTIIGRAYIIKRVLKRKKDLVEALLRLSIGGIYKTTKCKTLSNGETIIETEEKEVPPSKPALEYLLRHIDGSNGTTLKATRTLTPKKTIDDIINEG